MIKIDMKNEKSLDSALKKLKFKFAKNRTKEILFDKQQFTKPSIEKREQKRAAKYRQSLRDQENKND